MNDNKKTVAVEAKIPPHSKESEMMVLGCMITSINGLNIGAPILSEDDFYYQEHKTIFAVLKSAYLSDKPADVHLVCEELKRQDTLKEIGGIGYVTSLAQYAGTSVNIEEYSQLVKNKALLRQIINASEDVQVKALSDPKNVQEVLNDAQHRFYMIDQKMSSPGKLVSDILSGLKSESEKPFLSELEERQENYLKRGDDEPKITGIPTHFVDLDNLINGLENSNLNILAARPAMGKTALALNIAENVCFKNNIPVGFFSLEMSAEQLVHRVICSQAEVSLQKIKTGSLDGMEYQRVVSAVNEMQNHVMIIDDQAGIKITDLRARARRMKETYDVGLIVVDYLQLLSGSNSMRAFENRQNEISEISRMLKTMAKELNVPVLCLSQLSRKVEERQGHRPLMSDLRESGSIEQDSDIILFLFRKDYYDPMNKPGLAELIIAKNRHGSVGNIHLAFRKEFAQFVNYTPLEGELEEEYEEAKETSYSSRY